jgi:hypothetical protein
MIYYADSVHAFTDPEAGNDNSKELLIMQKDKRSWERMNSLKDVLK